MTYTKFKSKVMQSSQYECENPNCDTVGRLTIHHFFPRSRFPQYKLDPRNGMHVCGTCHAEIERRIRLRDGSEKELYPIDRYGEMEEVINGNQEDK